MTEPSTHEVKKPGPVDRVVIVGLYATQPSLDPELCLDELASLVVAADGVVVGRIEQRRGVEREDGTVPAVDPATWIGKGKVEELADWVAGEEATLVVFDNELSPAQIRELEKRVQCRVIDRSELILDIFANRARTREARLQVELAQLQYTAPRLRGMWTHLERQAGGGGGKSGGIGTRGPGEQQIEIDRRIVQKRLARLRAELDGVVARREREVRKRTAGAWTVGLVGYTNAGKSTLLNTLTGADAFAADMLFATLDTVSRRWPVRPGVDIPLSDTVGFVRNLPHHLVASFRSTLAEALHADLLLVVVDAAHPQAEEQVDAVFEVLDALEVDHDRLLGVLNKTDLVEDPAHLFELGHRFGAYVRVSAKTGAGLDALADAVIARRSADWIELAMVIPHTEGGLVNLVHEHGEILAARWGDDGWHVRASMPRSVRWQLEDVLVPDDQLELVDEHADEE